MITTVKLINTSITSHNYLWGVGGAVRTQNLLSQQTSSTALLTIVTLLYIRSPELILESLYSKIFFVVPTFLAMALYINLDFLLIHEICNLLIDILKIQLRMNIKHQQIFAISLLDLLLISPRLHLNSLRTRTYGKHHNLKN